MDTSVPNLFFPNTTLDIYQNATTDINQLLVETLGQKRKDIVSAVALTFVYSIIFLSGMVGNICTCLVIARSHSMQTTTNYYLFSLAVSDLLLIFFGLPPELYAIWEAYPWRLGEPFCYLRQTVLELTSYASVLTITAFTVERYLAICHPLLAHKITALSRAVKIIITIWTVSVGVALPYAVHTRIYYGVVIPGTDIPVPDSLICSIPQHFLSGFMYYMFQVSTFLFFIGPVTLIVILYIMIGIALRRSPLSRASSDEKRYSSMHSSSSLPHQPRRVVIRMLVAVTAAFIICWAPFHTQRLMILYVSLWTPHMLAVQSHIFYISGVLYFVSSTVNPILYNVISKRYRAAFKQIIFPCCHGSPQNTTSIARHSERFSKSQAMVVLKNGHDSLRVVFRQDSINKTPNMQSTPLNGRGQDNDDEAPVIHSSNSSEDSVGLPSTDQSPGRRADPRSVELESEDPAGHYVIKNKAAGIEFQFLTSSRRTVEELRKAERPRNSYAHQVNGRACFKPDSVAFTKCDPNHKSVVR
ncbi:neuromedin-U receptor 2-like [Biomphalaria glabrata]|uniref:Neuromedin-U receptor 2-like n=1 Tax=Biomphalaria glabrata TaxID=6526 RepID=A0A9W3AQD7_BIOGL|nr:neuromedin-U receptor 2-like [Biomphalaria glabrata]